MKTIRLLVVDDYFDNLLLFQGVAMALGHITIMARNGLEALKKLENDNFDLIFMDIEMPEMNGIDATTEIRTTFPPEKKDIPIIAISAHNADEFTTRYSDVGFNEFVSKPYTLEKIKTIIKKYTS